MRYTGIAIAGLVLLLSIPSPSRATPIEVRTGAEEAIADGETRDMGLLHAFLSARLRAIDRAAERVTRGWLAANGDPVYWHARLAQGLRSHIVDQQTIPDDARLRVFVQVDSSVDLESLPDASPETIAWFTAASAEFGRITDTAEHLRRQFWRAPDPAERTELRLRLELLEIDTARLACFSARPLAGEDYCGPLRATMEEGYRLASTIAQCAGLEGWRIFSPYHRLAAYITNTFFAYREGRLTLRELLAAHRQFKETIRLAYAYLQDSELTQLHLFDPAQIRTNSAEATAGQSGSVPAVIPFEEWTYEMVESVARIELGRWEGIMAGWTIAAETLRAGRCGKAANPEQKAALQH